MMTIRQRELKKRMAELNETSTPSKSHITEDLDTPGYKKDKAFSAFPGADRASGDVPDEVLEVLKVRKDDPPVKKKIYIWYIPKKGMLKYYGWTFPDDIKRIEKELPSEYDLIEPDWGGYLVIQAGGRAKVEFPVALKSILSEIDLLSGAEMIPLIEEEIREYSQAPYRSFYEQFRKAGLEDFHREKITPIVEEMRRELQTVMDNYIDQIIDELKDYLK